MIAQLDKYFITRAPSRAYARLISYVCFEGRALTTRGRWINPLVFTGLNLARKLPAPSYPPPAAYILGTGRSGTTIMGNTLAIHPDVAFLNEPKALWHFLYKHEDIAGSYTSDAAFMKLTNEHTAPRMKADIRAIYWHLLRVTGSGLVIDKYPELIYRTSFVKELIPNARFIILTRNGFDAAASVARWNLAHSHKQKGRTIDWWGINNRKWRILLEQIAAHHPFFRDHLPWLNSDLNDEEKATVEWLLAMEQGIQVETLFPNDTIRVRYEDYLSSEDTRNDLLQFCRLRQHSRYEDYCRTKLVPATTHTKPALPVFLKNRVDDMNNQLGHRDSVEN